MRWIDRQAELERIDGEFTGRFFRRFTSDGKAGRVTFAERPREFGYSNCFIYLEGRMINNFRANRTRSWKRAKDLIEHAERRASCVHEWRREFMNRLHAGAVCRLCGRRITGEAGRRILIAAEK